MDARATEHFDIYYDEKAENFLPRMAHYLEGAWQDVGDNTRPCQRANSVLLLFKSQYF